MGEAELKSALQRSGEACIRGFWDDAETTVENQRAEIRGELDRLQQESVRLLESEAAALRNNLLFEAQTKAMECRLHAEAALEKRLYAMGVSLLRELAGNSCADIWTSLIEELPVAEWAIVTVHPEDRDMARKTFPEAEIDDNEHVGGGLIVTSKDNSIRVDNSLACRLKRIWPDLLPDLLAELRQQVGDDEFTRINSTS